MCVTGNGPITVDSPERPSVRQMTTEALAAGPGIKTRARNKQRVQYCESSADSSESGSLTDDSEESGDDYDDDIVPLGQQRGKVDQKETNNCSNESRLSSRKDVPLTNSHKLIHETEKAPRDSSASSSDDDKPLARCISKGRKLKQETHISKAPHDSGASSSDDDVPLATRARQGGAKPASGVKAPVQAPASKPVRKAPKKKK